MPANSCALESHLQPQRSTCAAAARFCFLKSPNDPSALLQHQSPPLSARRALMIAPLSVRLFLMWRHLARALNPSTAAGEAFPAYSAVLTVLLRVLGSGELMRELPSNETLINSASIRLSAAAPLRPQRSTVFPHTNTFCGEFRASCSANICFPK